MTGPRYTRNPITTRQIVGGVLLLVGILAVGQLFLVWRFW